jgi:hypothetical protein
MMLDVCTHLLITDALSPLLQSLRALFMPYFLGHPLPLPFVTLYSTPARSCRRIRPYRGPHYSRIWLAGNINYI